MNHVTHEGFALEYLDMLVQNRSNIAQDNYCTFEDHKMKDCKDSINLYVLNGTQEGLHVPNRDKVANPVTITNQLIIKSLYLGDTPSTLLLAHQHRFAPFCLQFVHNKLTKLKWFCARTKMVIKYYDNGKNKLSIHFDCPDCCCLNLIPLEMVQLINKWCFIPSSRVSEYSTIWPICVFLQSVCVVF